jgi:hypothetical protein
VVPGSFLLSHTTDSRVRHTLQNVEHESGRSFARLMLASMGGL